MITITNKENKNYLAKVVEIKTLKPIKGADRIQIAVIDFQEVIVSNTVSVGDIMVYFPVECAINPLFLSATNSFRDSKLNKDPEVKGFFDDKGRVKAIKMIKGTVKSMGYAVSVNVVEHWAYGTKTTLNNTALPLNVDFDTINGIVLVEKYRVPVREARAKQGNTPTVSRMVDGQVRLHVATENLRRNSHKIKPDDVISITYKTHGTSWWVANVIVLLKLTFIQKVLKYLGINIVDRDYDVVYGSRKVILNKTFEDPKGKNPFYGYDLWKDIKDKIGESIPKGFTLYGEMVGYTRNGKMVQNGFDYGCVPDGVPLGKKDELCQSKLEVYRITYTNVDGKVFELSKPQIKEFCERAGLDIPHEFFYGTAGDWLAQYHIFNEETFEELFILELERQYNDKRCFMCNNEVPEEGVVIVKENLHSFEAYKLKSQEFLIWESATLDKGESDIESEN